MLECRAVENWRRKFVEELSIEAGDELTVLRTSMSGWWYAMDRQGRDGLVPFMYLEIVKGNFADFTDLSLAEYHHIENTVFTWSMQQITQVLFQKMRKTADEQHTLLHALRRLFQLCNREESRFAFLQAGGLDRLHDLMLKTGDIAQRMFCLRNIIFLAPTTAAKRYPARRNLADAVATVMEEYMEFPSFVATAVDAISNICFENEEQRSLCVRTNALGMLIHAMKRHRERFGIQFSCSRALANLLQDGRAQAKVDEEAVRTMLDALNQQFLGDHDAELQGAGLMKHQENLARFAQQLIIAISFLLGEPNKANTFAISGGFRTMRNVYFSVGVWDEPTRGTIVSTLNNMSQSPATAKLFTDNVFEGYDTLCEFLAKSPSESQFFFQIFSILTYLTMQLRSPILEQAFGRAVDRQELVQSCEKALKQTDNVRLMEAVVSLVAIAAKTKKEEILGMLMMTPLPYRLMQISMQGAPSSTFLNYTFITLYNLSMEKERAQELKDRGVLQLCTGPWHKDQYMDDTTAQNGAATMANILKHLDHRLPVVIETEVEKTIGFFRQRRPALANVVQYCQKALLRQAKLPDEGSAKKRPKKQPRAQPRSQPQSHRPWEDDEKQDDTKLRKQRQRAAQDYEDSQGGKKKDGCLVM